MQDAKVIDNFIFIIWILVIKLMGLNDAVCFLFYKIKNLLILEKKHLVDKT